MIVLLKTGDMQTHSSPLPVPCSVLSWRVEIHFEIMYKSQISCVHADRKVLRVTEALWSRTFNAGC